MATYAIMGTLSFNTAAKRDAVLAKVTTVLANKPAWGDKVAIASSDHDNLPSIDLEVRFQQYPDNLELWNLAKTELNKLTGVKATFHRHICFHDENPVKPCVVGESVTIVN